MAATGISCKKGDDTTAMINAGFSAYPNPASGIVTFSCNVPGRCTDMKVVVSNALGERIAEIKQTNTIGKVQWSTKGVTPGVYMYEASCVSVPVSKGKLVIMK